MSDQNINYATDALTSADVGEQLEFSEVASPSAASICRPSSTSRKNHTAESELPPDRIRFFMNRVEIDNETGCWMWSGACFSRGYGAIPYNGKNPGYAHRFSYELHHGPIPDGAVIMHKCDRKRCVNPAHLRAGTQKQNIHDAIEKGCWMTDKRKKYLRNAPQNFRFGQPENRGSRYMKQAKR